MKFWDGEKYRQLSCSCEAAALRASGFTIVDDDAPAPVAPSPKLEVTNVEPDRMGRRGRSRP